MDGDHRPLPPGRRQTLGPVTANLCGLVQITASPWERVAPAALTHLYLTMGCASSLLGHLFNAIHAGAQLGLRAPRGWWWCAFLKMWMY